MTTDYKKVVYKPHVFAEVLGSRSWVRLISETIAFRGSKLAGVESHITLKTFSKTI